MRFASLQSDIGIALLKQFGIATEETDSVIFIRDSRAFIKSDAALEIAGYLKQPWSWLRSTSFIPRRVRDFFYDGIAKNRYAVFGKKEACWLPTPETKERFMTK